MTKKYSKITILVDMDDTIEQLLPAWMTWLNNKYGTHIRPEEIIDWNVQKFFPSLNKEEVYAPLYNDDFWTTVEPKEGATVYLSKLMELGFNLYICTTSNYQTIHSKLENIISKYFPFIPWERVITLSNKQLINADILVDDGIHNLIGGTYKKILMTASHNKNYNAKKNGIVRVDNWEEAYREIITCSDQLLTSRTT